MQPGQVEELRVQARDERSRDPDDETDSGNRGNRVPTEALNLSKPKRAFGHAEWFHVTDPIQASRLSPADSIGTEACRYERKGVGTPEMVVSHETRLESRE
jgi:hypothetical protein